LPLINVPSSIIATASVDDTLFHTSVKLCLKHGNLALKFSSFVDINSIDKPGSQPRKVISRLIHWVSLE
jgi:hypothetical protein